MLVDSSRWRTEVRFKGQEREPLIVIDDFLVDPTTLVEEAARQEFTPMAAYYPGIRAPASRATRQAVVQSLLPIFAEFFGVREKVEVQALVYSLVTQSPELLAPIQRLPHYDGTEENRLALVLYLCDERHGGTGFYRHRSTEFETVSTERYAPFSNALHRDVERLGLPSAGYISGDTPLFERIEGSPAVFNRALIYRGRNLHSADVGTACNLSPNPRLGRLTLNGFLTGS